MTRKLQVAVVAPERDLDLLVSALEWQAADALDDVALVPIAAGRPASTLVLAAADAVILGACIEQPEDGDAVLHALETVRRVSPQEEQHFVLAIALWGERAHEIAPRFQHPAAVLPPPGAQSAPALEELAERLRATAVTVTPASEAARYELLAAVAALEAHPSTPGSLDRAELDALDAAVAAQSARIEELEAALARAAERLKAEDDLWRRASAAEAAAAELRGRSEELASQLYQESERADAAEAGKRSAEARVRELFVAETELERAVDSARAEAAEIAAQLSHARGRAAEAEEAASRAAEAARQAVARATQVEAERAELQVHVEALRAEMKALRERSAEARSVGDDREGRRLEVGERLRRAEAERETLAERVRELERDRATADALNRHFDAERDEFRARERRLLAALEEARAGRHSGETAGVAPDERVASMLSELSHELRSALSAIVGFTSLLIEDGAAEPVRETLARIDRNARSVLHVFNNVLDLAKLEEGRTETYAETVELGEVVAAAAATAGAVAGARPEIRFEASPGATAITTDRAMLQQALANVLAIQARRASTIRVEARVKGDRVALEVRAEGAPRAAAQAIGDRAGAVASRRLLATLGATLDEHDGVVHIELPRATSSTAADDEDAVRQLEAGAVLLFAADPNEAFLLGKYLSSFGRDAVVARSSKSAMALAGRGRPASAVVDSDDPGALALVGVLASAGARVIAFGSGEWREEAGRAGAVALLARPIDRDALARALEGRESSAPRVLVVDDEADARDLLTSALTRAGYDVTAVDGGAAALEHVRRERPDVVVLDLMMPGMDGFETAYHLSSSQDWRTIPVLLVTAKDLTPEERRALGSSVAKIVPKGSFGGRDIVAEIGRILSNESGRAAGS